VLPLLFAAAPQATARGRAWAAARLALAAPAHGRTCCCPASIMVAAFGGRALGANDAIVLVCLCDWGLVFCLVLARACAVQWGEGSASIVYSECESSWSACCG